MNIKYISVNGYTSYIYIYREILYIKALANQNNILKVIHDLFSVLFYSKSDRRQKIGDVCKTLFNDKC